MKKVLLMMMAMVVATVVSAADVIVKRDAERIEAKVIELSKKEIKYKKLNNIEGPTYVIPVEEVESIMFENGEVQVFEQKAEPTPVIVEEEPVGEDKYKFEVQPEDNYFFGIMVGYATRQFDYKKAGGKRSMASNEEGNTNTYTPSFQFGLMFQPAFKFGLGFRTGIITNYARELWKEPNEKGEVVEMEMHDITLGVPLDLSWRCKLYKKLSASIYTGAVVECGAWQTRQLKGSDPSGTLYDGNKTSPYSGKEGYWGINISWEVGASIQWDRLRIDVGGDFGLMNKGTDANKVFWNRPVYVSLTCMF
ncbi:MAG: hypothetical protein IJR74_00800 [Paludibacteraceae bacterium]|nr:hypothetical protein [Paludibacteraceae bacterium]